MKIKINKLKRPTEMEGVTLVELAVVVSIIFILATLALSEFTNYREKSVRHRAIQSSKSLLNALEMYKIEYGDYPTQGGATQINLLTRYVNVDKLKIHFRTDGAVTWPSNGLMIYRCTGCGGANEDSVGCIYGAVKELSTSDTNRYLVMHCGQTNEGYAWGQAGSQPACYWQVNGAVVSDWHACSAGL